MLRRMFAAIALFALLASALAACGQTPPATGPTAAPAAAEPTAPPPTAEPTSAPAAEAPTSAPEPTAEPTAAPAEPTVVPSPTPVAVSTFDEAAARGRTVVRWFVGLGAGTQPAQIPLEEAAVEKFNQSQDEIYLALEIIDNTQAYNVLATRIASGDVPDILGPIGLRGRNGFPGLLLDLAPLIEQYDVDLSRYPQSLVDFYNVPGQGQIGLPYALYPSFIYFNKDLFDEAGLPYPPQQYGELYDGKEWTIETMSELAMLLTVDEAGNDATMPEFDPNKIAQFGFHPQWINNDRSVATLFGAGSVSDEQGNAQIPDHWRAAWKWYHDAMFTQHFAPSDNYTNSDAFGNSNVFNSGKLAMAWSHIWYTCCADQVANWDIAVMPSYAGTTTAKIHADTFSIMAGSKNPDAAFKAMLYLLESPELIEAYGAMPAVEAEQAAYFAGLDERYAATNKTRVNWQVAIDSLNYPDNPSHEADMPNFLKAQNILQAFSTTLRTTPDLDFDATIEQLQQDLQAAFDEVKE
ncbi:MAG: extracellular solute-binding protein [Chloroflexi bacterium OHK40]